LRSEALQECRRAPDLLELTAELDVPELDAWTELLGYFLLPPPPRLLLELASGLNEAFVMEQSLDGLLRLHRLHALARTDLKARIGVLRALISKDPENHAWREDLLAYETRRLVQLEDQFSRNKSHDLDSVAAIKAELDSTDWVAKTKPAFRADVDRLFQRLSNESVREQLVRTADKLNQAFAEFDVVAARLSQKHWSYWLARTKLPIDDPLYQQVDAALRWIAEEDATEQQEAAFETELKRLELILDRDRVDYEKASRQFRLVENFQREIPPLVLKRFYSIQQSQEVLRRRKSQLLIGSVSFGLVGVGLFLGWYLYNSSYERHTATVVATIGDLVAKSEFKQAQQVLDAQTREHAYLANIPQIQTFRTTVDKAIADDENRKTLFESLLEKADRFAQQEATWESLSDAEIALNQAKQHTDSGATEATRIQVVDSEIRRKRRTLQQSVNDSFQNDLALAQTELKDLSAMSAEKILQLQTRLQQLSSRPHVLADLRQSVTAPLKQITAEFERRKGLEAQADAFRSIIDAVGKKEALRLRLLAYREIDPNSSRGQDFQRVIDEDFSAIDTASKWNSFVSEWNRRLVTPVQSNYESFERDLQTQKEEFPGVPASLSLSRFQKEIEPYGARIKQDPYAALRTFLEAPIVQKVKLIRNTVTNRNHYFVAPPQLKSQRLEVTELESVRGTTRVRTFDTKELQLFEGDSYIGETPHALWAQKSMQFLDEGSPETAGWGYEQRVLAVLNDLLERPGVDPLFAGHAINQVMEIGMTHSLSLQSVLAVQQERYQREVVEPLQAFAPPLRIDMIDWLSPTEDERRRLADTRIKEWRQNFSASNLIAGPLQQSLQELEKRKPKLAEFAWAGCVFRENEEWRFTRSSEWDLERTREGKLYVARIAANRVVGWQEIGSVVDSVVQLSPAAGSTMLRDGKPIFFMQ
jgi:hypothetical protein